MVKKNAGPRSDSQARGDTSVFSTSERRLITLLVQRVGRTLQDTVFKMFFWAMWNKASSRQTYLH